MHSFENGASLRVKADNWSQLARLFLRAIPRVRLTDAVAEGVRRHAEIHSSMEDAMVGKQAYRRSATIWSWWFTVVLVFTLESFMVYRLLNSDADPVQMARFLSSLALSALLAGGLLILLPWREPLNWSIPDPRSEFEASGVMPIFNPPDFIGGWFQGGRLEAARD